jgi:hypothetical protein
MGRCASEHPPINDHMVIGSTTGRQYDCRDLKRLDAHLVDLSERIARAAHFPGLQRQYRSDQSELLDRREWLLMQPKEKA